MAKQSVPSSSSSSSSNALFSNDDLSKWELINHDEGDNDGILFEVQSVDSFSSETLEMDTPILDLHESVLESLRNEIPKNGIDVNLNGSNSIWGKHHVLDDESMPLDHGVKVDVFNESMSNGHLGVARKQRLDANGGSYAEEEDEMGDEYDMDDDLVPWGSDGSACETANEEVGEEIVCEDD
ncbi:hypothetical protein Droror1_Dr00006574 [Drosera rotundifolia]